MNTIFHLDPTCMSAHAILDRKTRIDIIERTIGWGTPIAQMPDPKGHDVVRILTDTGVLAVQSFAGMILTAWIANVGQAEKIWESDHGTQRMPNTLKYRIHYNNNTPYWHKKVAA